MANQRLTGEFQNGLQGPWRAEVGSDSGSRGWLDADRAALVTRLCDVDDSKIVGFPKATAAVSVAVLKCSVFFLAFVPIHTDAEMCVVNWGRGDSNAPIQRW